MSDRVTIDGIRDYWTGQAKEHGSSPAASWSDIEVIEMEIREISKFLFDGDRVLDIGCANGYSTVNYALEKNISIRGVDYIPEMVKQAKERLKDVEGRLAGMVEFKVGDITALEEEDSSLDKVIVTRVIINLGSFEDQLKGVAECARVLKPGGTLLMSEATVEGWEKLNKFRREWRLPDIPMPSFNNYLEEERLIREAPPELEFYETLNFSSTYYVGTRLLKPLLINTLGADIDVADGSMEWNKLFARLPSWGDYDVQKLFVFKKR